MISNHSIARSTLTYKIFLRTENKDGKLCASPNASSLTRKDKDIIVVMLDAVVGVEGSIILGHHSGG